MQMATLPKEEWFHIGLRVQIVLSGVNCHLCSTFVQFSLSVLLLPEQ